MKKLFILLLVCCGWITLRAQTPNFNEWFRQKKTQRKYLLQQIAALKVYLEYLKKGYKIVDKGLTTIGDIKNGTFTLDKDYLYSLKQVSPVVKNSPKVAEVLMYQRSIITDLKKFVDECRNDENLSAGEVRYIEDVYANMLKECDASIDELTVITTSGEAEMKDDERLLRLDKVHDAMQNKYTFTQDFIDSTRLLSMERAKEKNQIKGSGKLYSEV
jgi:S-adenosylmethionine synthetase